MWSVESGSVRPVLRSSNLAAKLFVRLSGRSSAGFVGIAIASEEERFWELAMISLESVAGFGSDGVKVVILSACWAQRI